MQARVAGRSQPMTDTIAMLLQLVEQRLAPAGRP
jgi:hypothetical protein